MDALTSLTQPAPDGRPLAIALRAAIRRFGAGVRVGPVELAVPSGASLGLIGANGAGKTTVLKMICGLLAPTEGAVEVWGEPVDAGVAPPLLGAMIEEPRFYPWLGARENLSAAAAGRAAWEDRIEDALTLVGLQDVGRRVVREYSQGMRQRLGLARALLGAPRLLVLDEPTNGLDPHGIRWMRDLLAGHAQEGRTVVLSSHLLGEVQQVCDSIAVMAAGELLTAGDVDEVARGASDLEDLYFQLVS